MQYDWKLFDILHGSGAVVEPAGLEVPDPVEYFEQNHTKEEIEKGTIDPSNVDLLNKQHDHFKYFEETIVNIFEFTQRSRNGYSINRG